MIFCPILDKKKKEKKKTAEILSVMVMLQQKPLFLTVLLILTFLRSEALNKPKNKDILYYSG